MIPDEGGFQFLRYQLTKHAPMHEHRRVARITKTIDYDDFLTNIDPLGKAKLLKQRERAQSVILH